MLNLVGALDVRSVSVILLPVFIDSQKPTTKTLLTPSLQPPYLCSFQAPSPCQCSKDMNEDKEQDTEAEDTTSTLGVSIGGHHIVFILVLVCLILLLSITVTLLCCIRGQINRSTECSQGSSERKTLRGHGKDTKQTQTSYHQAQQKVCIT